MTEIKTTLTKEVVKAIVTLCTGAALAMGGLALTKAEEVNHNTEEIQELGERVEKLEDLYLEMVKFNAVQLEINENFRQHIRQ